MMKTTDSRVRVHKLRIKPDPKTTTRRTYLRQLAAYEEQQQDAIRLMTYFNRVWQRKKNAKIVNHPITRLQRTVRSSNRFLVNFAASIWFEREFRGTNFSGKVSGWSVRRHPKVNAQMARLMKELTEQNVEAVQEMWKIAAQKNTVEIVVKTKVTFANAEQADMFCELLSSLEIQND